MANKHRGGSPPGSKPKDEGDTQVDSSAEGESQAGEVEAQEGPQAASSAVLVPPEPPPPAQARIEPQEPPQAPQAPGRVAPQAPARLPAQPVEARMVRVRPRVDIPRCSIGGVWYSFAANKPVDVPEDVRDRLQERGVL